MRRLPSIVLFGLALALGACSDEPGGGGDDDTDGRDGGMSVNGGDDGGSDGDGGTGGDGDGGGGVGDGGRDGGDPLTQTRSEFCSGSGSVVIVGGGGECAGEIAEDTFRFALCTCEGTSVGSQLSLDAFDSTVGPYGGANILDDGSLGSNGALDIDGKLTARGSAFIHGGGFSVGPEGEVLGTVYANGDAVQSNSSTDIGRNAFFNGNVSGRFNIEGTLKVPANATVGPQVRATGGIIRGPVQTAAPCPCEADEILDIGALTSWASEPANNDNDEAPRVLTSTTWEGGQGPTSMTLPCGRYYVTSIDAPNLTLRVEGRVVLFVDGDMLIDGPLTIDIASEDAEIDLFIRGNLAVRAAARFGSADAPARTRTYVGGSDTIDLSASARFGGNLYAPRALVRFGASAELYGALFARSVEFGASATVHFDTAIRSEGDDCDEEEMDGGVRDAGPRPDAGPMPDAGVRDGGPHDAGPECTEDIDCPAPELCIKGNCEIPF